VLFKACLTNRLAVIITGLEGVQRFVRTLPGVLESNSFGFVGHALVK